MVDALFTSVARALRRCDGGAEGRPEASVFDGLPDDLRHSVDAVMDNLERSGGLASLVEGAVHDRGILRCRTGT